MATAASKIDFKKPRQKEWGIVKDDNLANLNYGYVVNESGTNVLSYSTNCYQDVLDQVHDLLASGTSLNDIQVVEFVPYDFIMTPTV